MVSGFVIQKSSLPYFWHWLYVRDLQNSTPSLFFSTFVLQHLSPFVYGFSGLMRATFLDVKFKNVPVTPPGTEAAIMYYSGNEVHKRFFALCRAGFKHIYVTCQRFFKVILLLRINNVGLLTLSPFFYGFFCTSLFVSAAKLSCLFSRGRCVAMILFMWANRRRKK